MRDDMDGFDAWLESPYTRDAEAAEAEYEQWCAEHEGDDDADTDNR